MSAQAMENDPIILFKKLLNNSCSPEEASYIVELLSEADGSVYDDLILSQLAGKVNDDEISAQLRYNLDQRLQVILADLMPVNETPRFPAKVKLQLAGLSKYLTAAVLIITLSVTFIIFKKSASHQAADQERVIQHLTATLHPGSKKAILTLNNGQQVVLTGAANGQLANEHNMVISKTADGKVVYKGAVSNDGGNLAYNTMTTPMGGTYSLVLADGSKVMLDAGSSIRYPVTFAGNERTVEIKGQAYFEVIHDKSRPFRVISNGQTVEVLGTHFNINAYAEEKAITTTLLEGKVKISKDGKTALLAPGQQSVVEANHNITISNAEVERAVAWKNDLFSFHHADLETVMRQFSRWYNVKVVYEGTVPKVAITGEVLRNANAEQILKILSNLGIHFNMDGQKIIITN